MHEIICPHCGKAFKIDEAGYADILKQVRDGDFEKQLHDRLELAEQDKQSAVELAASSVKSVGELWLRKLAKHVIQGEFSDSEGAKPIGFSHGHFDLVV